MRGGLDRSRSRLLPAPLSRTSCRCTAQRSRPFSVAMRRYDVVLVALRGDWRFGT